MYVLSFMILAESDFEAVEIQTEVEEALGRGVDRGVKTNVGWAIEFWYDTYEAARNAAAYSALPARIIKE